MKYLYLQSFNDFSCSGSDCPFTCCGNGWKIYIDKKTDDYYKTVTGKLGERLEAGIKREDGKTYYIFTEDDKCPFLNESGLCDIQLDLGEEHLCDTCRLYPRYSFDSGDIRFGGVSISCPEVSKYFLTHKESLLIDFGEDDVDIPDEKNTDWELFNSAIGVFSSAVGIAQNRNLSIKERIALLTILINSFQTNIDEGVETKPIIDLFSDVKSYGQILDQTGIYVKDYDSKLEYFTEITGYFQLIEDYEKMLPELPGIITFFSNPANTRLSSQQLIDAFAWIDADENALWLEQIVVYTIFRYFMQGFDKKRFYDMLMTAIILVLYVIVTLLSFYRIQNKEEAPFEYRMLLVSHISRFIEHDIHARDNALEYFKKQGLCDLSYVLKLIS